MIPSGLFANASGKVAGVAVIVLCGVGLFLTGYFHGRHVVEGEIAEAQRTIAVAYAGRVVAAQDEAAALATENATLRQQRETVDRIIVKEVVRYETLTQPALRCTLPGAWRMLHDAAATGEAPPAAAGSLAAQHADPVEDAAALATVADNYAACRDAIEQVAAWQRRYHALEARP